MLFNFFVASSKLCTGNRDLNISNRDLFFKIQGHYIGIVYVVLDKYKGTFGTQKFVRIFGKNIYIMILLTYFLLGVVSGFLIELSIHKLTDYKVGYLERFFLITLWPIMVIVWIYNFIVTKKD